MTRRALIGSRILLVLYLVTVFFLCFGKFEAGPDIQMSFWGIPTDKLVHFSMFLPFPPLVFFAFDGLRLGRRERLLAILSILGAGILIAAVTETAQYFIPYRSGEWKDLFADTLGLLASSCILIPTLCRKD